MPKYVWKGLKADEKKALIEARLSGAAPTTPYPDDPKTSHSERETKMKMRASEMEVREKEIRDEISNLDKFRTFGNLVFEKGVPLEVPPLHKMASKIKTIAELSEAGLDDPGCIGTFLEVKPKGKAA